MSWLQLRLDCDRDSAEGLEDQLLFAGALSVTLEDRADEPLLEPGVGETPLWQAVRITGLFPADAEMEPVLAALPEAARPRVEILEDRDWSREWMQHYRPMRFGERLWICPSWQDPPEPDAINLLLDPGLAFGTGTHPTTAMCLRALENRVRPGVEVVDYGCGSGILGIAALRLGAAGLLAVDNDPQALVATRDNARRNAIGSGLTQVFLPDAPEISAWAGRAELVVANILAGPLASLADTLCAFLKADANLILAGLLESQAASLIDHYAGRVALEVIDQQEEWVCLGGRSSP
jgi:ribosomal protein L11 methyltransferase